MATDHQPPYQQRPKFNLSILNNILTLNLNIEFAKEILSLVDDFEDLEPYLYSFREQLRTIIKEAAARRTRVHRPDSGG